MKERSYCTLVDVLPPIKPTDDYRKMLEGIKEELYNLGRTDVSSDELCFLLILERSMAIFSKAKTMIGKNRFTVVYRGPKDKEVAELGDFEVVALDIMKDKD